MPLDITGMAASSVLTSAFALSGKLPLQLDEVVVPVVVVGQLGDEVFGPGAAGSIAVAGGGPLNRSEVEVSLTQAGTAQGAGALLEKIWFMGMVAAQLYTLGPSPGLPAPTAFGHKAWRDVGRAGLPSVQIAGKNDAPASAFDNVLQFWVGLNETLEVSVDWIMQANSHTGLQQGLMIRSNALNEAIRVGFSWRERVPR